MNWWCGAAVAVALWAWMAIPVGAAEVEKIEIVSFGVGAYTDSGGGNSGGEREIRLVRRTDLIAAITGTNFYVKYVVQGSPPGAAVEIEQAVLQLPVGIYHPANPEDFVKRRGTVRVALGEPHLAGWGLAEDEFIEPGNWIVQLRYGGELLAEKMFEIVLP